MIDERMSSNFSRGLAISNCNVTVNVDTSPVGSPGPMISTGPSRRTVCSSYRDVGSSSSFSVDSYMKTKRSAV